MSSWPACSRARITGPWPESALGWSRGRLSTLAVVTAPRIELLWWEGCPSTERALDELRTAIAELGMTGAEVETREIKTEDAAAAAGFHGSPTILVEGADVAGADPDEPTGLTCRVYRRHDGRISPTPDPDDLREALRQAASRAEVN